MYCLELEPAVRSTQSQVALHLMVNQLSVSVMPAATRRQSTIVNDIPAGLQVKGDLHKLAAIIGMLLNAVIGQSHNSNIHISAKNVGNLMLLHIKDTNRLNSSFLAGSLKEVQQLAEKTNSFIGITNYPDRATTIALTFANLPVAA